MEPNMSFCSLTSCSIRDSGYTSVISSLLVAEKNKEYWHSNTYRTYSKTYYKDVAMYRIIAFINYNNNGDQLHT